MVSGGTSVALTGANFRLTEAPKYLEPELDIQFTAVNQERIRDPFSAKLRVTDWAPNGAQAGRRYVQLEESDGDVIGDDFVVVKGGGDQRKNSLVGSSGMSADGVSWAVQVGFSTVVKGALHTQIDSGGYAGAKLELIGELWNFDWNNPRGTVYTGNEINKALVRGGEFVITWQDAGGGNLTLQVQDNTRDRAVAFSSYIDDDGWGFMPPGVTRWEYAEQWGIAWGGLDNVETPQSERTTLLVQNLPAGNTEEFSLWIDGQIFAFTNVTAMPAAGTVMTVRTAFGEWNGDGTVFTQYPDAVAPGESWTVNGQPMTLNAEDANLSQIMVVPNPYMASSFLDLSPDSRRIEFVNLPDQCTIRIYSMGGHLVNVLNHVGANRFGWGDYTDWDRLDNNSQPREFTGYDNHSGTEPWNLRNRFGQTVASGLYFFHVTDSRGETHTGKFYIIN